MLLGTTILLSAVAAAAVVVGSWTKEPDLFDLTPIEPLASGHRLLGWSELERAHSAVKVGGVATGSAVRALGYMTSADHPVRNGQPVDSFIVVPELSHGSHPAPRFGDQMIRVRLAGGDALAFQQGRLLWVSGTLRILPGDSHGDKPLYELSAARAQTATPADIPRFFH